MNDRSTEKPAIIFDFGRVLGLDQNADVVASMARFFETDIESYRRAYSLCRNEYDRGTISDFDYWKSVASSLDRQITEAMVPSLVKMDLESWFSINYDMYNLVKRLHADGFRLFLLSNMNFAGRERLVSRNEWGPYFEHMFFSCDLGLIKPERAIYQYCVEQAGIEPDNCIFIDDLPANVEAAREFGMYGIVFRGYDTLWPELSRRLGAHVVQKGSYAYLSDTL